MFDAQVAFDPAEEQFDLPCELPIGPLVDDYAR
jgi:hypothetical protein